MIFNLGLLAYIIGNMTKLVVHVASRTRNFVSSVYGLILLNMYGLNLDVKKKTTELGCFFQIIIVYFTNLCFYVFI
uniref:Uncharacterized protein n=1 Tax=Brassica oleracea TaxID=3712 RepID=A0A3P6BLZ8_BRAOL|nr:unnamed protein product [Brassica oleracea]